MTPFWDYFLQQKRRVNNEQGQRLLALEDQRWRTCNEEELADHIIKGHFAPAALFSKGVAEFDIGAAAARGFTLGKVRDAALEKITSDVSIPPLAYPVTPTPADYRIGLYLNLTRLHQLCGTTTPVYLPTDASTYTTEISFDEFRHLL